MTAVLKVGQRTITAEEIIPLLARYQLLPQLVRELLVDEAIASVECSPEELDAACEQIFLRHQLELPEARQNWLKSQGQTLELFRANTLRSFKLEKFKQTTWGPKLESYFLTRKGQLDRVIYSLIRTQDPGIAQELYFRIQEGEQSLAELAAEYSQGPEAQTGGLIGPVELTVPAPPLARMLSVSKPGQLWPPTRLGEWFVIVRLEKFLPVQLDDGVRQRLLNELFNGWLQEQLAQLGAPDSPDSTPTASQ